MAASTMMPSTSKLNMPLHRRLGDSHSSTVHHPLSPHVIRPSSDKFTTHHRHSDRTEYVEHAEHGEDILPFSHPLSPHATCPGDDQAQSINEADLSAFPTPPPRALQSTPHPLSPHTSLDQDTGRDRTSSTSSSTSVDARMTPSTSTASTTHATTSADLIFPSTAQTSQKTVLLINGPNLNLLGHREPHIYGNTTLSDITRNLTAKASTSGIQLQHFQSNHEGAILDRIHTCLLGEVPHPLSSDEYPTPSPQHGNTTFTKPDAIIINPGALTHTSVALRDALLGISVPFIEVHISNVHARESFRHHSYLSDKAEAVIAGLGVAGYEAALNYWADKWTASSK